MFIPNFGRIMPRVIGSWSLELPLGAGKCVRPNEKSGPVTGCERLENAQGAYKERRELRLSLPQRPQAARVAVLFQHTHYIAVAAAAAARSPTMATQMSKKRKVCFLSTHRPPL